MTLSPAERAAVLRMVADHLVEEFRAEAGGDLSTLIVLPLQAAGAHLGLTPRRVAQKLPTVRLSPGKHGVTLSDLRAYIEAHTHPPAKPPATAHSPAPAGPTSD